MPTLTSEDSFINSIHEAEAPPDARGAASEPVGLRVTGGGPISRAAAPLTAEQLLASGRGGSCWGLSWWWLRLHLKQAATLLQFFSYASCVG